MDLRIAGDNLVRWRFANLNLSLTGILKLNFVAYILLRGKFETTPSLPKQQRNKIRLNFYINQMCDVTFSPKSWGNCYVTVQDYRRRFADVSQSILFRIWVWDAGAHISGGVSHPPQQLRIG